MTLSAHNQTDVVNSAFMRLMNNPAHFDFVCALDILTNFFPNSVPLGELGPPERESIRLRPALFLGFPNADIATLKDITVKGESPSRLRLETCFLGLYGQSSPLPAYFTENLLSQDEPNPSRDFIDIFHHRMLSLAYRAFTKYHVRPGDRHLDRFLALIGKLPHTKNDELTPSNKALLACAGLMGQSPRSASTLGTILQQWLGTEVNIEQCLARWIELPKEQQTHLGLGCCRLGVDCIAGDRFFDRTSSFRIVLGPMNKLALEQLLPGGKSCDLLQYLVREFNSEQFDYEVEGIVPALEFPPPVLDGTVRLGWDSRLTGGSNEFHRIRFSLNSPI